MQRAVVLIVLEIAAPHQDQDAASFVIDPDHRALEIFWRLDRCRRVRFRFLKIRGVLGVSLMIIIGMLLGSRETSAQRIFGGFLEIGVDCCVNTKTFIHGPVPADGLDDFLPDVIDSVALSLRVLPIARHEMVADMLLDRVVHPHGDS